jgi:hypothetical protein
MSHPTRIGSFEVKLRERKFGVQKYVLTITHLPSSRVVWKSKTVYGERAFARKYTAEAVCRMLDERNLSAQIAHSEGVESLKAFVARLWDEAVGEPQ